MSHLFQANKKIFIIYIFFGSLLSYYIYTILIKSPFSDFNLFFPKYILTPFFIYLFSHLIRTIRLAILTSSENAYFGRLLVSHLTGNSLNIIIPFRLGEFFRYILISNTLKTVERKKLFLILLLEKVFDLFIICIIASLAILLCANPAAPLFIFFKKVLLITAFTILFVFPMFYTLMKFLNAYVAVNFDENNVLRLNLILKNIIVEVDSLLKILFENLNKILLLTIAIWLLEIGAAYLLITNLTWLFVLLRSSLLFCSNLLPTGPAGIGGLHISEYWYSKILETSIDFSFVNTYILFIFSPAALLGVFLYFVKLKK
jgi:hypothetical protein